MVLGPDALSATTGAISSVVEHFVHTEGVTGSNPVSPTPHHQDMTVVGVLRQIQLFPVKSLPGSTPPTADVGPAGLVGDRLSAVVDGEGVVLRVKQHPRLRQLRLTGPGSTLVATPDGSPLPDFLGVPGAHLAAVDGGARQVAPVHLVSTGQRLAPGAGDSSRANLVVDLGPDEPAPDAMVGALCSIGAVVLRLGERPRHCAGLFAAVVSPGALRVGDEVRVGSPG